MKYSKLLLYSLVFLMLLTSTLACGSEKQVAERKNLMMPKQSEMMRNSRYKEAEKRKTNKVKLHKSRNKRLF
jgi:hypothetical protein